MSRVRLPVAPVALAALLARARLIPVTFDGGSDPPRDPRHVLLAALGARARPGLVGARRHDHSSLERTPAEGFGAAPLSHGRHAAAIS